MLRPRLYAAKNRTIAEGEGVYGFCPRPLGDAFGSVPNKKMDKFDSLKYIYLNNNELWAPNIDI